MKNASQRHKTKASRVKTTLKSDVTEDKPLYLPIERLYFNHIESGEKRLNIETTHHITDHDF